MPDLVEILCYNGDMDYEFSVGWLIGGLVIAFAGVMIVIFYRQIANALVNGVSSYDKVKLVGIITIIVGFLLASNLFFFILSLIVGWMFGK